MVNYEIGSLFLVAGLRTRVFLWNVYLIMLTRAMCSSLLFVVCLCMIHILMPFLYNVGSSSLHRTICKCDNGVPMSPSPSVMA